MNEGNRRVIKIFALTVIFAFYLFFLVWTVVSPLIFGGIPADVVRFSILLFLGLALIFVTYVYSGYVVGECPNCRKRLFFHRKVGGMRCFRCGRFLRVDLERKVIVDSVVDE